MDSNTHAILMVTGSRTITEESIVFFYLDHVKRNFFNFDTITEGEAGWHEDRKKWKISVDLLSRMYAEKNDLHLIPKRAEWNKYGRIAGFVRNAEMVRQCDYGVAIWDGMSAGTEDAIRKLKKAKKLLAIFLQTDDSRIVSNAFLNHRPYIRLFERKKITLDQFL